MWSPFPSVYPPLNRPCLLHGIQNAMVGAPYVKIKITGIINLRFLDGRERERERGTRGSVGAMYLNAEDTAPLCVDTSPYHVPKGPDCQRIT